MHRESQKKTPKDTPCHESAAALSLLALSTTANVGRAALAMITPVPVAVSVLPAAAIDCAQNERKHRAVHGQAHACATTLIAKERAKEGKENRRTTAILLRG